MIDLVLDVDGVFNAFPPVSLGRAGVGPIEWGWECEPTEVEVIKFPITYSTLLIERINALAERPDVTPYWLTTWLDRAPMDLCPALGLNGAQWPVLGTEDYHSTINRSWWKFPAIKRHVEATDHRVVWVDDDLAFDREAQAWVTTLNVDDLGHPRVLGIAPETHNGLTLAHLDLIEHWIETGELP